MSARNYPIRMPWGSAVCSTGWAARAMRRKCPPQETARPHD